MAAADTKIVDEGIPDKKASDVLFEMESDENKDKWRTTWVRTIKFICISGTADL